MSEQILRHQLYEAYKNRGMMYYHIFQELRKEVGDERAIEIIKRGIYNRGLEIGKKYAKFGPSVFVFLTCRKLLTQQPITMTVRKTECLRIT